MPKSFAILGAGNVGTALALVLAEHKRPVKIYSIEPDVTQDINSKHENRKYLKGVKLQKNIRAYAKISEALLNADVVILAVPSFALKEVMTQAIPFLKPSTLIGSITKGLDETTLLPLGVTAAGLLPKELRKNYCLIGGPAIANEIAHRKPSALLIASDNPAAAKRLAACFQGDILKAGTSADLLGVGYAMALKNIYAISLGLTQGLDLPMNTRALVMTQAVQETGALLKAAGAQEGTAMSLAGLGDLLVTGLSAHSRNRTYGEKLVHARTNDPKKLGLTTVEGIRTAGIAARLAKKYKLKLPLLQTVVKCITAKGKYEQPFIQYLKDLRLK